MKLTLGILVMLFFGLPVGTPGAEFRCAAGQSAGAMELGWMSEGGQFVRSDPANAGMMARREMSSDILPGRQDRLMPIRKRAADPGEQVFLPDSLTLYTTDDTLRMSASYTPAGWNHDILVQIWWGNRWVNYSLDTWTYLDSNGNSIDLQQRWLNGHWVNATLDSSTYDEDGNMLVHLYKYWTGATWHDSIISYRTYDGNGNMLTNLGLYMEAGGWTNFDQSTYTYDGAGNALTYLLELWIDGQWKNSGYSTYTYDGNGNTLSKVDQYWQDGQWKNSWRIDYTYDGNGHMLTMKGRTWNGTWDNSSLTTCTYGAGGYQIGMLYQYWSGGVWTNHNRYTYTNDADGNVLTSLYELWSGTQWRNSEQSTYAYDDDGNLVTGDNMSWSNPSWIPADNSFPVNINGDTYHFTGYHIAISYIAVDITDIPGDMANVVDEYALSQNYPNPFNPSTVIRYSLISTGHITLKVYDLLGREVATLVDGMKQPGTHSVEWDASAVPGGVYFYRMQAGDFKSTKKLLLLK
jgi:hypothetical protein